MRHPQPTSDRVRVTKSRSGWEVALGDYRSPGWLGLPEAMSSATRATGQCDCLALPAAVAVARDLGLGRCEVCEHRVQDYWALINVGKGWACGSCTAKTMHQLLSIRNQLQASLRQEPGLPAGDERWVLGFDRFCAAYPGARGVAATLVEHGLQVAAAVWMSIAARTELLRDAVTLPRRVVLEEHWSKGQWGAWKSESALTRVTTASGWLKRHDLIRELGTDPSTHAKVYMLTNSWDFTAWVHDINKP